MFEPGRRLLAVLFAAVFCLTAGGAFVSKAQAQIPYTSIAASEPKYAAIVVDANTGEVLYQKQADGERYPASITKIMTLYLTFEALSSGQLSLNDTIVISPRAAAQPPTKLGARAGETVTVDDAIRSITLLSANDMAVALAEKIGGTESRFAAMMTLKARQLGMTNSRFVNASGLPDSRQLSTARDIAILSRAVLRDYPQYYSYFSLREGMVHGRMLRTHNHILDRMEGADGIKTGFTNASGYNLAASAVRYNHRLIAVVLGGNSSRARDNHVQDLLETGFDVINRRQRGEVITVAQNLFEPAPIGPLVGASVEQGDGGDNAAVAPAPIKVAAADDDRPAPKAVKTKAPSKSRKPKGDWLVQVGAFRQKALAQQELKRIERKYSAQLADAEAQVVAGAGKQFRARFIGLSAAAARAACASMKSGGNVCAVMSAR